jgi:ABC-type multidrug transport system fused ATPase/permease subunit
LQLAIIALSLLWTAKRLVRRRFKKIYRPEAKASSIRLPFEICVQIARAISFAFFLAAAINRQTLWLNPIIIGYAFLLGLLRLINDLEWRHIALDQVNFVLSTSLLVLAASTVLPCIEPTARCSIPQALVGGVASLAVAIFISIVTPREWIPPHIQFDAADQFLDAKPAPEETSSIANYYITYDWLTPLLWKGSRQDVRVDDLPSLAWYDEPSLWLLNVQKARAKGKSTFWTVMRLMRKELTLMALWITSGYLLELIAPFALYQLLDYLAHPSDAVIRPWVWLLLMFIGPMSRSVCWQQYVFTSTRLVIRVKSSFTQELYHAAMSSMELEDDPFTQGRVGKDGKGKENAKQATTSIGRLANLMAADVDAIYGSRDTVLILCGVPAGTIVSLIGLYKMLGWPSLVGSALLLLSAPASVAIAQQIGKAQVKVRRAQDSRISLVTEYLSSFRAIKYFAWEEAVCEKIDEARKVEQNSLWRVCLLSAAIVQVVMLIPYSALLLMFGLYIGVLGNSLSAATAFTTVYLVKDIRRNLAQAAGLSRSLTNGAVAIGRLDRYFESIVPIERYPAGHSRILNGCFRRNKKATFQLKNISIDFVQGGLNVINGQSGSGKTTLLLAILGETIRESGSVTRPQDVAYASQTAWLQNDTVKANILFTSDFEQARYDRVIEACCLPYDFAELENGDETMVGENGATLSGGQKSRVALARAFYSKAPLLLLDDIFSALDAKTAASLWELCFCSDMLKGRTVILVAQLPWVASQADLAITLEDGSIKNLEQNIGVVRKPVVVAKDIVDGSETSGDVDGNTLNNTAVVAENKPAKDVIAEEMEATGKRARLMCKLFYKLGRIPNLTHGSSLQLHAVLRRPCLRCPLHCRTRHLQNGLVREFAVAYYLG